MNNVLQFDAHCLSRAHEQCTAQTERLPDLTLFLNMQLALTHTAKTAINSFCKFIAFVNPSLIV